MTGAKGSLVSARTTAHVARCDHCGRGYEVVIQPKDGKTFDVPRSVLDRLARVADRLDDMGVKVVQLRSLRGTSRDGEVNPQDATELEEVPALPSIGPGRNYPIDQSREGAQSGEQ